MSTFVLKREYALACTYLNRYGTFSVVGKGI